MDEIAQVPEYSTIYLSRKRDSVRLLNQSTSNKVLNLFLLISLFLLNIFILCFNLPITVFISAVQICTHWCTTPLISSKFYRTTYSCNVICTPSTSLVRDDVTFHFRHNEHSHASQTCVQSSSRFRRPWFLGVEVIVIATQLSGIIMIRVQPT